MNRLPRRHVRLALGLAVAAGGAALALGAAVRSPGAVYYDRGQGLAAAGMLDEAADAYLEAIRRDPRFAAPYRALAEMSAERGYYHVSADYWHKYVSRHPDAQHARCRMAYSELMVGMEVPALEHAEAEVEREPSCGQAHLIAGILYARKSEAKKALEHLNVAVGAYPELPRVSLIYGRVLALSGSYDEAEAVLRRVLDQNRAHAEPYYWLGYVYSRRSGQKRNKERAREYLQQALDLAPEYPEANYQMAQLLHQDRNSRAALPYAARAVAARRGYVQGLYLLAQIHEALGNSESAAQARQQFQQQSRRAAREKSLVKQFNADPENVNAAFALGQLQLERDNPEGALIFLRHAAQHAPADARVQSAMEEAERRLTQQERTHGPSGPSAEDTVAGLRSEGF